ncbi:MAG: sigma-54 dependent transcriptional regulator [Betaproteobacteria bacterium]
MSSAVKRPHILIVDDEPDLLELLELTLLKMGLDVTRAATVARARESLSKYKFDLCLTDMRMPDGSGMHIVEYITSKGLDVPVAVMTAYASTENAVAALKAGAFDYLHKPVSLDDLRSLVKSALKVPESEAPAASLSHRLLGQSTAMAHVRGLISRLAKSDVPVSIHGESGSGKELAARMLHSLGPRAEGPFIPVNCGAIPETLMESEFFGYRKGAFTGADADRNGFFQAAHQGTLFLDEVADLPLPMQVKLLRVIQESRVRKVGATQEDAIDVRIICATHQRLRDMVDAGKFRQDLYFRINVIELSMPPLREMHGDIPNIAASILARLDKGGQAKFDAEALAALQAYPFPGNVRELENILERALALALDPRRITVADLHLVPSRNQSEPGAMPAEQLALQDYLDQLEKRAILKALEHTHNNRTAAAKALGITFRSMRYRMERLGIN